MHPVLGRIPEELEPHFQVNTIDPEVDVIRRREIPPGEGLGFVLPLSRKAGDRAGRQTGTGAEELFEGGTEVAGRQPVQVQQRQHLGHLRGFAGPCRQDRRGEPPAFTGVGIDALVVDPRRAFTATAPAAVTTSRSAW